MPSSLKGLESSNRDVLSALPYREIILKVMVKFSFPVSPKYNGPRTF